MVETARNALNLWALQLVPSLLPFMILCNLFTAFLDRHLSINHRIYIIIMGNLCGYPLGAKITADHYKEHRISKEEAAFLMTVCNQSSPAFLEFYTGVYALGSVIPTHSLFILFYTATIITIFIARKLYPYKRSTKTIHANDVIPKQTIFQILDHSITDSCKTIIRIGGYVLLFSIIMNAAHILLKPLGDYTYLLISSLEITNGLSMLKTHFSDHFLYTYLILALTGFGGFCTAAQIKGMLVGTSLSIKSYFVGKIIYTLVLLSLYTLFSKINIFNFSI